MGYCSTRTCSVPFWQNIFFKIIAKTKIEMLSSDWAENPKIKRDFTLKFSRDVHNFEPWIFRKKWVLKWCICIFSVAWKCSWEQNRNILKCSVRTEQYRTFFWCRTFCSDRTFGSDVPSYPDPTCISANQNSENSKTPSSVAFIYTSFTRCMLTQKITVYCNPVLFLLRLVKF